MAEDQFKHPVYSKETIEYVTVAGEFIAFLESTKKFDAKGFLLRAQKLIPLLYIKAALLPKVDSLLEEETEKFVSEADWTYIYQSVQTILGEYDYRLDVFNANMQDSDLEADTSISENLADIYQDVKNFLLSYRMATLEVMNDALWEHVQNFETYWGQRLADCLRAIHWIIYNVENPDADDDTMDDEFDRDNWIISRRQDDFRDTGDSGDILNNE